MADYTSIRMANEAFEKAQKMAESIGWSGKQFAEECILAIHALHTAPPDEREVPRIVIMLDAMKRNAESPVRFSTQDAAKKAGSQGVETVRRVLRDKIRGQGEAEK